MWKRSHGSMSLLVCGAWQAYSKNPHEKRFCKDVCVEFLCLFLEHFEVSMGFIIPKMIGHVHSAIWVQKLMQQVPNSFVLCYFSKKDFWARQRASWPNLRRFFAQNNQKELILYSAWGTDEHGLWNSNERFEIFTVRFDQLKSSFEGMFRKQKYSLGSYLIVEEEKSENRFAKILEFLKNILASCLAWFWLHEGGELALFNYTYTFLH